jgi:hypothetical protein
MAEPILNGRCSAVRRHHGLVRRIHWQGTPDLGLGLSALALLAGYNVFGVFAFLDELCNRVFRPGQAVALSQRRRPPSPYGPGRPSMFSGAFPPGSAASSWLRVGLWILPVGVRGSCAAVRKSIRIGTL